MRLTKAMKEEIVSSILRDVPKVDHTDKIVSLVQQYAYDSLPDELKAVPKTILTEYLEPGTVWKSELDYCIETSIHVITDKFKFDLKLYPELVKLVEEQKSVKEARAELKRTLVNNIYAISTAKQFEQRYPELVKYLDKPVVHAGLPTFPLTDMLTKAGWNPGASK